MNFWYGVIVGMAVMVTVAYTWPLNIRPVQDELVKLNHGSYNSKTTDFELKECK